MIIRNTHKRWKEKPVLRYSCNIGKKVLVTVGKFKEQKGIIAQFGEKVDSHILPKTLHYVYVEFPSGEQTKILSIYLKYA